MENEKCDFFYSKSQVTKLEVYIVLFFPFLVYLFLAVLGLRCCTWGFSNCGEQGLLFVAVCGLLTAVASPAAEHRL